MLNLMPGKSPAELLIYEFNRNLQNRIVPESGDLAVLRKKARQGNPFPLIAFQWPDLIIKSDKEAKFFKGEIGNADDPCLRLDFWQRDIIAAAFDKSIGEVFVKGCTGAGKGACFALVMNLLFDVFNPCRIHITSETFSHAQTNLFGEFATWRKSMAQPAVGRLLGGSLVGEERHYVMILNPTPYGRGESFSGLHSEMTVFFFDEASALPQIHYEMALKNGKKIFAASNPRITEGMFRDAYRPLRGQGTKAECDERENTTGVCLGRIKKRLCVSVPGNDCLNVRHGRLRDPVAPRRGIEINGKKYGPAEFISDEDYESVKVLIPNQIDLSQYQNILDTSKEQWEIECYAHAKFPGENPIRQVILPSWLPFHIDAARTITPDVTAFGLDVARSESGDNTELTAGGIKGVASIDKWKSNSNTYHVQKILRIARNKFGIDLRSGENPISIDMGGRYGAGVSDRLKQLGVWVIEFIPAGRALVYPQLYSNQRAEWYCLLSRRLDPADNWTGIPFVLPDDMGLHEELCSPLKIPQSGGTRIGLENKEDIKKRLGRSPDSADSVVCFWRAVFEQHNLLEKMNERTDNMMLSSSAGGEGDEIEDLDANEFGELNEHDEIELPPPSMTITQDDHFAEIMDALGAAPDDLKSKKSYTEDDKDDSEEGEQEPSLFERLLRMFED
jgi:hypothetical protein